MFCKSGYSVSLDTLHYYDKIGLLSQDEEIRSSGIRKYQIHQAYKAQSAAATADTEKTANTAAKGVKELGGTCQTKRAGNS